MMQPQLKKDSFPGKEDAKKIVWQNAEKYERKWYHFALVAKNKEDLMKCKIESLPRHVLSDSWFEESKNVYVIVIRFSDGTTLACARKHFQNTHIQVYAVQDTSRNSSRSSESNSFTKSLSSFLEEKEFDLDLENLRSSSNEKLQEETMESLPKNISRLQQYIEHMITEGRSLKKIVQSVMAGGVELDV